MYLILVCYDIKMVLQNNCPNNFKAKCERFNSEGNLFYNKFYNYNPIIKFLNYSKLIVPMTKAIKWNRYQIIFNVIDRFTYIIILSRYLPTNYNSSSTKLSVSSECFRTRHNRIHRVIVNYNVLKNVQPNNYWT